MHNSRKDHIKAMRNVSLYVHIPFCLRKCLFCSFAIAVAQEHKQEEYVQALLKEMDFYQAAQVISVYLGGGTPSTLTEASLMRLMQGVAMRYKIKAGCEVTMEANPEDLNPAKLQSMKKAGINRLSIGVQSFDERYLKFLGHAHTVKRAVEAFKDAHVAGFSNISGDLMYGFPGQTREELIADIDRMIACSPTHISIYTLTIEPNSRFYAEAVKLDHEDKLAEHYQLIIDHLRKSGFDQYEVSNFAKKGYQSQHNRHYWTGGEYIGVGMGAHGYWKGTRYWNQDRLNAYLEASSAGGSLIAGEEELSADTKLKERLIFGLRMNEGIDLKSLDLDVARLKQIHILIDGGFLTQRGTILQVTDRGRMVLDDIAVKLI